MKKILIIEDDQIVANVYRNKLTVEGYRTETAADGETGLKLLRTFKPQIVILDLMLPGISGVDVIKEIRKDIEFSKVPTVVFSNTYLTNLIQEAWRAGANKCLSKSSCTPRDIIDIVRGLIGDSGSMISQTHTATNGSTAATFLKPAAESDSAFQADLRTTFIEHLPSSLYSLRSVMQALIKADNEIARVKQVHELYRLVHAINGNAGVAGLVQIAHMSAAFEALLKEVYEKPKNITTSSIRTIAATVDFLGLLFEKTTLPEKQELPPSKILVVDDEAISRRAIVYALEKARLKSINVDDSTQALQLMAENDFDLIFLDVDMPGLTGFELCAKLRLMPKHKKTPVIFVTSLNDFDSRTSSTMAGGNDFIAKPFLFIELTVKALTHVMRGKLHSTPLLPR
ncbi:MAG: response regulator [Verrucomicrobiota bacterium]|jgi:DNA-binding response OmpR family regulator